MGGRKLRAHLSRTSPGVPLPSPSTITAVLRRHGLLSGPKAGMLRDWQRFERPSPNDLWQMDFKGHFGLTDGTRCHPLTVLEGYRGPRLAGHPRQVAGRLLAALATLVVLVGCCPPTS